MGEYGLKIKNIEASTLYEYNLGIREYFEYTGAMLTNSLFFDFLQENGMKTYKETTTRDIICLTFNYGTRSYEEHIKHCDNLIDKYTQLNLPDSISKLKAIKKNLEDKQDICQKLSKERVREIYYKDGCDVTYITKNKRGEIKKIEKIHYKMLYRSSGKAKKGACMFIRDKLYNKARDFLYMGIKLPKTNAPIVEISAYSPLVSSTIVGKIQIHPENILIIKDIDSYFTTNVVSIETNDKKQCVAKRIENYSLKNTLFDGQALIESSLFPEWANGYILLRHHFCKMAAFNTNIQQFYQDKFGENYLTAKIVDMFGNEHYAKDIELITTENAMKWMKFDVSYEYWCQKVNENNAMFGIVKTAHKSKLGDVQRMSYQMVNSLDMGIMPNVCKQSLDYIDALKTNDDVFLQYLKDNSNFSNDYEVLVALVEQNRDFLRSEYFRNRKERIIRTYVKNFRSGHILQNGDNLTIVGSPYEMLFASIGKDPNSYNCFEREDNTIQCYTERFGWGEYLAEFRSPFNSKNNMGYLHNIFCEEIYKYFNLGENVIAINMINTDFQDRNNGSDQDSDSIYVTNQKDIVNYAKYCYINYPTIVNNIPKEKNKYDNCIENFSLIDNNLAAAQGAIGQSSNLAQIALTYSYNFSDEKYEDYVCILSVLAQCAIDNAKRRFDIDIMKEIRRIKKDMCVDEYNYPKFWKVVQPNCKGEINKHLQCPMNYLSQVKIKEYKSKDLTLPMDYFFINNCIKTDRRKCKKVEDFIQKYSFSLYASNYSENDENFILLQDDFDDLIEDLQKIYLSNNYIDLMYWLINRAFMITTAIKNNSHTIQAQLDFNKSILIKTLYKINPKLFLYIFSKNVQKS